MSGLFSTPPLRCALEELGEDRVMFSVDYPYESSKEAGDWLDNAGLAANTLIKVALQETPSASYICERECGVRHTISF